jgi:hypothetical protein
MAKRVQTGSGANVWLTAHYPHLRNSKTKWHIYLKKPRPASRLPKIGDMVIFYETHRRAQSGVGSKGRKAVVRYATVNGDLRPAITADPPWRWEMDCTGDQACSPVTWLELRDIAPSFRRPTGLRKLKPQELQALKTAAGIQ